MPDINLKIEGKQAVGDGTKIVCMNGDYVVHITTEDCDGFVQLPYKKLVVKYDREYKETYITVDDDGKMTAPLPLITCQTQVEIGVVGRYVVEEDAAPHFASKPAIFDCSKSILCGAVALSDDLKLLPLEVHENGKYLAAAYDAKGFVEVDVAVHSDIQEEIPVTLNFPDGATQQEVTPTEEGRTMKKVTILKPSGLSPENIVKDVKIAGVTGTHETILTEKEITANGDFYPGNDGADGFSKVTVNVQPALQKKTVTGNGKVTADSPFYGLEEVTVAIPEDVPNYQNKSVTQNGTFSADEGYDAIGSVTVNVPIPEEYIVPEGTLEITQNGTVDVTSKKNVKVAVPDKYMPRDISTESAMMTFLSSGEVGAVCRYTGATGTFTNGALYVIEEE